MVEIKKFDFGHLSFFDFFRPKFLFYNFFLRYKIKNIGVTGTHGKGTVVSLIRHILSKNNINTAMFNTINDFDGKKFGVFKSSITTPLFSEFIDLSVRAFFNLCKFLAMEVTSHSIVDGRVNKIYFHTKVLTNIYQDHLDFHNSLSSYVDAKASFFKSNVKLVVLNSDDSSYDKIRLVSKSKKIVSYAIDSNADYKASNISFSKSGLSFDLFINDESFKVKSSLIGRFNIYNLLAAIAVCNSVGISVNNILSVIPKYYSMDGRMEEVVSGVFIDYSHAPFSLKEAIDSLIQSGYKKVITVFGCGGDRDASKRSLMGKFASEKCDRVIVTSDNCRSESFRDIAEDIIKGMNNNYEVIDDRKEAIKRALKFKDDSDTAILIAGKGHEKYIEVNGKKFKHNDKEFVLELLNNE